MPQRLQQMYTQTIAPALRTQFDYNSAYEIPRISKIVINRGVGADGSSAKILQKYLDELTVITGQRGVVTTSKKAIAAFKLRENMPIGVMVTLRGDKMYAFLDRLIHLALPRMRDFQGIPVTAFDATGNYNLGLPEQLMFPEVSYEEVDQPQGMDISIVTTANNPNEGFALLQGFKMPFNAEDLPDRLKKRR